MINIILLNYNQIDFCYSESGALLKILSCWISGRSSTLFFPFIAAALFADLWVDALEKKNQFIEIWCKWSIYQSNTLVLPPWFSPLSNDYVA